MFDKEELMYNAVARYFEASEYTVVVDKPKGSGIRFQSLKGWTIDVVGIKRSENVVVAVEVKRDLGASAILDALSKAEMYRNVCTESYVAFPKAELRSTTNRDLVRELLQECRRRGIGLLEVGAKCALMLASVPSSLSVQMMMDILVEFERRTSKFVGFEEQDFARFYSVGEDDIPWHKFELLAIEVAGRLKQYGLAQVRHARQNSWWFSFADGNLSKRSYWTVPHISFTWWDNGVMGELIVREGKFLNNLRRRLHEDSQTFHSMIKSLKRKTPCEIEVSERTFLGGYATDPTLKCSIYSKYAEAYHVSKLVEWITDKHRKKKVWLWIGHLFELAFEARTANLVDSIVQFVDDLMPIYRFVIETSD